jgi:hypothetical protein
LIPAQQGTCFFYLVGYHQHFTKTAWQRRTLRHAGSTKIRLLETGSLASIQTVDPNDLAAGPPARQQIDERLGQPIEAVPVLLDDAKSTRHLLRTTIR